MILDLRYVETRLNRYGTDCEGTACPECEDRNLARALLAAMRDLRAALQRTLTAHSVPADHAYYPDGSGCVCGGCDHARAALASIKDE